MRHPFLRTLAGASAVATDPNFENVTLLLHGDGTNGGQNNSFVDGSTNNFTITRNGNTTQGTFSPYGDNWSNYFDGTGDYLTTPDNAAFDFGTGDFTIECWVYVSGNSTADAGGTRTAAILGCFPTTGTISNSYGFFITGSTTTTGTGVFFQSYQSGTAYTISATTTVAQSTWHHIAVARSSTTTKLFLNGSEIASSTLGNQTVNSAYTITIGRIAYTGYLNELNGYISNLRVLKGTAQYTGSYTVPTAPLTAITNTSLLTCGSNRFRDASTNNFTITRNGDVSVQRFSPFSPTAAYAAGTIGGSGYFDGTGDNLATTGASALGIGTSAFTLQGWCYFNNTNTNGAGFGTCAVNADAAGDRGVSLFLTGSGAWRFRVGRSVLGQLEDFLGTTTLVAGQWYHFAIIRTSTGTNDTRVYLNGVQEAIGTSSISLNMQKFSIGTYAPSDTTTTLINGYVCDVRFTNTAESSSVPTAPLTVVSGTQYLCKFQNAAILDNAMMAVPETVGNAQIDTTTKKYGTGSLEFDGTGDWLLVPDSPDQRLGTGNFTIECWLYLSATGTARGVVGKGTSTTGWLLSTNTSNAVVFTYGTSTITSTGTLSGTTWYHIAVVREGTGTNQTKIYIGGTNDGTGTVSTDFTQTNAAYVGANRTGGDPMNGYIDDLRITKGVARYTATFTPPTAAFPDL